MCAPSMEPLHVRPARRPRLACVDHHPVLDPGALSADQQAGQADLQVQWSSGLLLEWPAAAATRAGARPACRPGIEGGEEGIRGKEKEQGRRRKHAGLLEAAGARHWQRTRGLGSMMGPPADWGRSMMWTTKRIASRSSTIQGRTVRPRRSLDIQTLGRTS